MRYNKISKRLYLIAIIPISISEETMNFDRFSKISTCITLIIISEFQDFKFYASTSDFISIFACCEFKMLLDVKTGLTRVYEMSRSSLGLVILYKTSPQWRSHFVIPNPTSQISFREIISFLEFYENRLQCIQTVYIG